MRIVADTAILVRANAKASGPARELFETIRRRGSRLVVSPYLRAEVERVLGYPRIRALYRLDEAAIAFHLQEIDSVALEVIPPPGPPVVPKDANDDPIIHAAVAAKADVICTVDKHFFDRAVLRYCAAHGIHITTDVLLLRTLRERE